MEPLDVLGNLVMHLEAGGTYEEFRTDPRVPMTQNEHRFNLSMIDRIVRTRKQDRSRHLAKRHAHD